MTKPKAYPYPQIVTGDEWHVLEPTDSNPVPRTDNLNKQMYVPMDRECERCGVNHSRMIRRHELGHAKWSPKTMGKLMRGTRSDAIEALEEVRINYRLGKAKLPIDEFIECEDKIKLHVTDMMFHASIADVILYVISSAAFDRGNDYTEPFEYVLNVLNSCISSPDISVLRQAELKFAKNTATGFIRRMITHKYGQLPSYRKTQKLAEQLSFILNEFIDKPKPEDVKPQQQTGNGQGEGESTEGSNESDSETLGPTVDDLEKRMRKKLVEDMQYSSGRGIGRWGEMTIHTPAMSVNLQGRLKNGRLYRPSDYGYNPKYINRYCIDKKIFKQKQRVKGGTILIDASGSMNFNGNDILEIMQLLPAVNIAMYNGSYNTGDLHIIAKNGMRVNDIYIARHVGRGNVIDGPALQWLASMPERRIWVSDMQVFGSNHGDSAGFNLLKDCYNICTANKIINLKDIEEVKEHALKLNQVL